MKSRSTLFALCVLALLLRISEEERSKEQLIEDREPGGYDLCSQMSQAANYPLMLGSMLREMGQIQQQAITECGNCGLGNGTGEMTQLDSDQAFLWRHKIWVTLSGEDTGRVSKRYRCHAFYAMVFLKRHLTIQVV